MLKRNPLTKRYNIRGNNNVVSTAFERHKDIKHLAPLIAKNFIIWYYRNICASNIVDKFPMGLVA